MANQTRYNYASSSVLKALFKRKGGEGQYTRVVTTPSAFDGLNIADFRAGEEALIRYYKSELLWCLLSNRRLRANNHGEPINLGLDEIAAVGIDIKAEYLTGSKNKKDFSLLSVVDIKHANHTLAFESGPPFYGIYNALGFAINRHLL